MLTGALLILAPLFLGFALSLENRHLMTAIHYGVEGLVYFILALLGLGLGQMEGVGSQLANMASQVAILVLVLFLANMAGLWLFHRWQPMAAREDQEDQPRGYRVPGGDETAGGCCGGRPCRFLRAAGPAHG